MKIKICAIACAVGITMAVVSCTSKSVEKDYAAYVNPFIGTGGHGHTFPGAVVPNGMIQPSPDTRIDGWDASSGYYYADSTINGFSHTHVSGTGCADYGDILLMPDIQSSGLCQPDTAVCVGILTSERNCRTGILLGLSGPV